MIILLVLGLTLFVYSLLCLQPNASVVKVGYGDIGRYQGGEWSSMINAGGYRDGSWMQMLAFPILALIFGVLHKLEMCMRMLHGTVIWIIGIQM